MITIRFGRWLTLVSILGMVLPLSAAERHLATGHVPGEAKHLQTTGNLASETPLRLAIGLPLRNGQTLENLIRDIFSCCLLILMVTIAVISILLLFIKKGKDINNLILIAVIVFVLFCLFLGIISGSFS